MENQHGQRIVDNLRFSSLDRERMEHAFPALERLNADQAWMSWPKENYLRDLPSKWEFSRTVSIGGELVACAICSLRGRFLWLHRLVVLPAARGRGVGARVLEELEGIGRTAGVKGLLLKTPLGNPGALRFYERSGYVRLPDDGNFAVLRKLFAGGAFDVGIHQPNYLPWLGYLYKMSLSDAFFFLDDVSFPAGSFVNRNRVCMNGEAKWLTVPAKRHLGIPIREAFADGDIWIEKHLRTIQQNYRRSPFFEAYFPEFSETLRSRAKENLAVLNSALIRTFCRWLGLGCLLYDSSSFATHGTADERLVELVQMVGGGRYISGSGGMNYQSQQTFDQAGITLTYSNFFVRPYRQSCPTFLPGLASIDAFFNIGAEGVLSMFKELEEATHLEASV